MTTTNKPQTANAKLKRTRKTVDILRTEGTKALEALAKLKTAVKDPTEPAAKLLPAECAGLVKDAREFLKGSRNEKIKKGLMPDTPESHAEIKPLFAGLRPGDVAPLKGNRLSIDPEEKEDAKFLKELFKQHGTAASGRTTAPATTPAGFLFHLEDICRLTAKPTADGQEKTAAKLRKTAEICMAYLEILEETEQNPLPNGDEFSFRTKRHNAAVGAAKTELLAQSLAEPVPEGTPRVSPEAMASEVGEDNGGITTGDAVQMAVIFAERHLKPLSKERKRETLFRMRSRLAHDYFELTKKLRREGHPDDCLLPQKPRYKTPCVMLVRHPVHEHCEVVCIQPQSALSCWGNPEAEKADYAIVKSSASPETGIISKLVKSETCSKAAKWITAGVLLQLMAAVGFLAAKGCSSTGKPEAQTPIILPGAGIAPEITESPATVRPQPQIPARGRGNSVEWR